MYWRDNIERILYLPSGVGKMPLTGRCWSDLQGENEALRERERELWTHVRWSSCC